jgi:hypothetical protein
MSWKNWSYWVKGGMLSLLGIEVISLLVYFLAVILSPSFAMLLIIFQGFGVYFANLIFNWNPFDYVYSSPQMEVMINIFILLSNAVCLFIIGAIIGQICNKSKGKK